MVHREIQLVTLEDYVMKESENNEDSYTQVGEILVGTLNMKRAMQEIQINFININYSNSD